jgi:hypothetical protein
MSNVMNEGGAALADWVRLNVGAPQMTKVVDYEAETLYLYDQGRHGDPELVKHPRPPRVLVHTFNTIGDLCSWLSGGTKPTIFVGESAIRGEQHYAAHNPGKGGVALELADPFKALKVLTRSDGLSHEELHVLLATRLAGNIDEALLLTIEHLRIDERNEAEVQIARSGGAAAKVNSTLQITVPDPKGEGKGASVPLGLSWQYTGPVYAVYDRDCGIDLRLYVRTQKGRPRFYFTPVSLEQRIAEARLALVEHVRDTAVAVSENFEVYDGEL